MVEAPVIHWFRRDLRLIDNRTLNAAFEYGSLVLPVFILDDRLLKSRRLGVARLELMLKALVALDEALEKRGGRLLVQRGDPRVLIPKLAEQVNARAVFAHRDVTPYAVKRDEAVESALDIPLFLVDDLYLRPSDDVLKDDGTPYVIYGPYKRRWDITGPIPEPQTLPSTATFYPVDGLDWLKIPALGDLGLHSNVPLPPADEQSALARLDHFTDQLIYDYEDTRNLMALSPWDDEPQGTSGLSPYLRLGILSARQAYHAAMQVRRVSKRADDHQGVDVWVSELAWRDFYASVMTHFPHVHRHNYNRAFDRVPYRHAPDDIKAWQEGQTGYPVIDAAMRQLNTLGWMHNRARMIVASFYTKDLFLYWDEGERTFMERLLDGDPASNNGGWQWASGSGTNPNPYFRIFHPIAQSKKFDPSGGFIRRWVPELRDVPDRWIHTPWEMATPPKNYPPPMVDHELARAHALDAFRVLKKG